MTNLNPVDNYLHGSWEALGQGAPMLVALAQLCNDTWVHQNSRNNTQNTNSPTSSSTNKHARDFLADLSPHALAILFAAKSYGMIEIRAVNSAFEAAARMLAVYVEMDAERTIAFRDPQKPDVTLRFLDGFRELCQAGLVIHHTARDFSLAPNALDLAHKIPELKVAELIQQATEFGLHD